MSGHADAGHRRLTLVKSVLWFYQSERLKDESQNRFLFVDDSVVIVAVLYVFCFSEPQSKGMLLKTCFVQT